MQEMEAENELFLTGKGDLPVFYNDFGIDLSDFQAPGHSSIYQAMKHMDSSQKTLFVHNTLSTLKEIKDAISWNPQLYWVSNPNANLYIENTLPDYSAFIQAEASVCLGTDSLCSNWQLSIIEEMKTIKRYQSYVPDAIILKWATLNGARALGFDDELGSLEAGKKPGLVLLEGKADGDFKIDEVQSYRRLI